jgi:osmoprotectant transport system permease protein
VSWAASHVGLILSQTATHLYLAIVPILLGVIISIPLGWS